MTTPTTDRRKICTHCGCHPGRRCWDPWGPDHQCEIIHPGHCSTCDYQDSEAPCPTTDQTTNNTAQTGTNSSRTTSNHAADAAANPSSQDKPGTSATPKTSHSEATPETASPNTPTATAPPEQHYPAAHPHPAHGETRSQGRFSADAWGLEDPAVLFSLSLDVKGNR